MALAAEKQELLNGFLGQLPEHVAVRLAKAIEVDRLIGGGELPHDALLKALRPQLRHSAQERTPTPQRFFCFPFEDLLVNGARKAKQKGRIARTSIAPVWQWLATDAMPEKHAALTEAIREAIVKGKGDDIRARSAALWSEAAAAMKSALGSDQKKSLAAKALGGMAVAEDAAEMALLLSAGETIAELQKKLPRPMPSPTEDDIAGLRSVYEQFLKEQPDLGPYVALIAMGRMEHPWEALHLAAVLSRQSTDTVLSNTDMGVVGELLFSDLDVYVEKIKGMRPNDFDPNALLESLGAFAELSSGMVRDLGMRRDGKWGQHLTKNRSTVAQTMESLMEKAPKDIMAALPPAKVGGFGKGPKPLDLTRAPDPDRTARALRYAHLLVHARPFAVAAAFNAKLKEAMDQVTAALRLTAEDLLRETRAAKPETQARAEQYLTIALDICALVLGEEETDLLRRRSRVSATA